MRPIDADALIEEHCEGCGQDIKDGCKTDPVCATLMWFKDAPTIDAVPVVHAKWIDGADAFGAKRGQYRVCSRCNICIPCVSELAAPYWRGCPNCLARMDGE